MSILLFCNIAFLMHIPLLVKKPSSKVPNYFHCIIEFTWFHIFIPVLITKGLLSSFNSYYIKQIWYMIVNNNKFHRFIVYIMTCMPLQQLMFVPCHLYHICQLAVGFISPSRFVQQMQVVIQYHSAMNMCVLLSFYMYLNLMEWTYVVCSDNYH